MLTLEQKIGQMLMVGFDGLEPPDYLLEWVAAGRVGGIILFGRNVDTPAQVAALVGAFHAAAAHPLLIAIDQEGGTVARLRAGFTESPGALALGVADSEELAEAVSAAMATELRALGINWNLAPVVDITHNIDNPSVGTRSLGTDAARVSRLAAAEVRGFQRGGVAASAKHFPGLANTPVDTHVAQAVISGSLDYLWERDLVPFRAAVEAGTATVMVSHVTFEALDAEHPATLSPQVIQGLLRDEIGFSGLACTDCMEMRAISDHYTPGESAVLAALAGQDLILFSHRPDRQAAAYDALVAAARSGRLPEAQIDAAVARVQAVKERFAITAAPDPGQVRQPERLAVMQDAARRGMVTLRLQPGVLPLRPDDTRRVALIEFASILESGILESGGVTGFASAVRERLPGVERVSLGGAENPPDLLARARALAAGADVLVLATRNAHLMPTQRALAQALIDLAPRTILLCLRNPYDADALTGAGTVLCTCGDSTPSLQTAVDALLGTFVPLGRLPVSVRTGGVA